MIIIRALFATFIMLITLSGCAYRNNYPISETFPIAAASDRIGVYVDANGTFFPDRWRDVCPDRCQPYGKSPSLLLKANSDHQNATAFRVRLAAEEKRQLTEVARFVASHPRLFILIHGFNSDEPDIKGSYDRIVDRIKLSPGDGIIEFYWDGFVTSPPNAKLSLAPARFWPAATAHSQAAGSRGLRRILALAKNRNIVLISHSRGASVILSALSNPPYGNDFLTRTERHDFDPDDGIDGSPNFLRPAPLPANSGNELHLLMLAPAIGCIDFRRPDFRHRRASEMRKEGCSLVRPLPPEVKTFDYTLNKEDSVLGKYILPSEWYSATDFGFDPALGDELRKNENWRFLKSHPIKNSHGHDFDCYVADPEFGDMLKAAGVVINPTPELQPRKPCRKEPKPHPKP
jgi:hypothetical protein